MRSCFNHLEKTGRIEARFHNGDFIKRPRWLLSAKTAKDPAVQEEAKSEPDVS